MLKIKNCLFRGERIHLEGKHLCHFHFGFSSQWGHLLTLWHSERPKLHRVLAILSAIGLKKRISPQGAILVVKEQTRSWKGLIPEKQIHEGSNKIHVRNNKIHVGNDNIQCRK